MKATANIYKLILVVGILSLTIVGCAKKLGTSGPQPEQTGEPGDPRGFDPLELPRDREVIPQLHPRGGQIQGSQQFVVEDPNAGDSGGAIIPIEIEQVDTVYSQAFRVQLATTKVYGEARREVLVAEEIFDRPVHLDYEVPYYKVRVGSFRSRDAAEEYQQRARSAGYSNAWVVLVNIDIKEPPPLYPDFPIPQYLDSAKAPDSADVN